MYFAPSSRQLTESEMVIHRLYEITSRHDAGLEHQIRDLLQLGLDRFGLDIGIVSRIRDETYEVVASVTPPNVELEPGARFELGNTYCSITVSADGPVGFEHASESSFRAHPAYGAFKLEAYIGIPIHANGGGLYGTLNFSSAAARSRAFEEVDIDCLRLMASWLSTELQRRATEEDLARAKKNLELLVRTDPLTELANRRGLTDMLESVSRRSAHGGAPLSCLLIDVDDFKVVNDRLGHTTGDQVLRSVAELVRTCLRPGDSAGRVGGDEFVAILPGASVEEATRVGERIAATVRTLDLDHQGEPVPLTVSIGVAEIPTGAASVSEVLKQTQELLKDSKRSGKDRVTRAHILPT